MIKNNSAIVVLIGVVIIISSFLSLVPAYSQIPYLPNVQSSSEKSQNSNTTITANKSNNNDSIASLSTHYLPRSTHSSSSNSTSQSASSNNTKIVIINFDDSNKNQYIYAKPVLDKYGFKATFFEVCNWVEAGHHDNHMTTTWSDIAALQQDGMDIQAHSMNHPHINGSLSQEDLDYEIGQSKQCLSNHGINSTIFAYPYGEGSNNSTVVNTVAKYYNLGRTDSKSALTFLHCNGGNNIDNGNSGKNAQRDCRPYFSNGTLTPSNRYSINSWAHRHIERQCISNSIDGDSGTCTNVVRHKYNNAQMFQKFVTAVNNQTNYNKDGVTRAIPIIIYHTIVNYPDLSYSNRSVHTTLNLFDAEMKYLHDNGFKVITMADLGYDENNNYLYIRGHSS